MAASRHVILVGGSVRAAATDAVRGGFIVTAIDRFGDQDLLAIADRWFPLDDDDAWLDRLIELPRGPIIPVGGFNWPSSAKAKLLQDQVVTYPRPEMLRQIDSPRELNDLADSANIQFPETHWLDDLGSLQTTQSKHEAESWIYLHKPWQHAGGVGICAGSGTPPVSHYAQRFIRGEPIGVNFIAANSGTTARCHLLGTFRAMTHKRDREQRFLYGGSIGPVCVSAIQTQTLQSLGESIAKRFGLVGLFNVDLVLDPAGKLWLLEINPRFSASMELLETQSLIKMHLECQSSLDLGKFNNFHYAKTGLEPCTSFSCKRIVYAKCSMTIGELPRGTSDVQFVDIPARGMHIAAGDPAFTIIVRNAPTMRAALKTALRQVAIFEHQHRDHQNHDCEAGQIIERSR